MDPIEVLKEHLYRWERALEKSKQFFETKQITIQVHRLHKKNLEPKIEAFKQAIKILEEHGNK